MTSERSGRGDSRNEARLTIIYWRDIPAQATARAGRQKATIRLSDRFQVAIDQAATRAGKTDADEYLAEWRDERKACGDDLQATVDEEAARLEVEFPQSVLDGYVRSGGFVP